MRLKEQRLWDTMRRNQPEGWWLKRIENGVGVGMPDVHVTSAWRPGIQGNALFRQIECWVELKAPRLPKRLSTPVMGEKEGLNQDQKNWHRKAKAMGMRTWILIRTECKKHLWLIDGCYSDRVNRLTVEELYQAADAIDWKEIYRVLSGVSREN